MTGRTLKPCTECGGHVVPHSPALDLYACTECGKPVVGAEAYATEATSQPEAGTDLSVPIPASEVGPMGDVAVPDFHEVMVGWRAWGLPIGAGGGKPPYLHSVTYGEHVWVPRVANEAVCDQRHGELGHVPAPACSCGLYAAKDREHLEDLGYHRYDPDRFFKVIGKVNLWGKVIEGTQGWRAQFGYPAELFLPYEAWPLAQELTDLYGVPVRLDNILRTHDDEE